MRNTFKDRALQEKFDQTGFVQFDFLNADKFNEVVDLVDSLNQGHKEQSVDSNSSYKLSFFNDDISFRKLVFKEISNFFQPLVDQVLDDYVPLIINIFDKEPGQGEVPVHQNWTFADEENYTTVSLWIPLCDVTRKNGTLEFIPGSHRVVSKFRSPSIPWAFDGLQEVLKEKYLQPIELVTGQAAILDDSIIHWSSENDTDSVRTTIQLILRPREATPIHYHMQDDGSVKIYKVDPEFFMSFNMKDYRPDLEVIDTIANFEPPKYDEESLVECISQQNAEIRKQFSEV